MGNRKLKQQTKQEWTRQEGRQLFGEGPVADPVRKAAALQAIRLEAGRKKVCCRPSLPEIFRNELSLISVNYWYFQAVLLCVGIWLSGRADSLYGPESLLTEVGISPEMFLLPVLSALLAPTGITGFGELAKCFSCRMAELEQSCYLNLRQLMMVRMAITGAVNLLFLGCFIGISQGRLQAGLIRISLYLMTPYVCNMLLFFTAFTFMRSGRKLFQVSVLLAAGFLSFLPMLLPGLYGKAAVGLWAAVLLGAAALMAAQMIYLIKELDRGEKICWN